MTTAHGMLDAWALNNSRLKKLISAKVYERDCLAKAACIQAFTEAEMKSIRDFGMKNPVCIIPNGVDLPPQCAKAIAPWIGQASDERKVLLFLGRLHPKKGLISLLKAWKEAIASNASHAREWRLVIAGWSQAGHQAELEALSASLGITGDVIFSEPLYGEAKDAAYRNANAAVLPSVSEGLPMSVLEAWSYEKPVLLTPQCNLAVGVKAGAAFSAEPDIASLKEGLITLFSTSETDRQQMGARGRQLVEQQFTWTQVAADMRAVYSWIVGGGSPPECVVVD